MMNRFTRLKFCWSNWKETKYIFLYFQTVIFSSASNIILKIQIGTEPGPRWGGSSTRWAKRCPSTLLLEFVCLSFLLLLIFYLLSPILWNIYICLIISLSVICKEIYMIIIIQAVWTYLFGDFWFFLDIFLFCRDHSLQSSFDLRRHTNTVLEQVMWLSSGCTPPPTEQVPVMTLKHDVTVKFNLFTFWI